MNRIVVRSIILILVLGLLLVLIFLNRSPFGKNNSSFASEPKEQITRIELSGERKTLLLEQKGETWYINGKTEARKSGIQFITRILKEIKIKSPVSQELFHSEISAKNISSVRVKVFENHKLLKSFLVYKTMSNIYGNIMKIRETSKPFIVYVPGYDGNIGSAFNLNEIFWQPYTVFNFLPSEIAGVKFENLADTASSFSIINRKNRFYLTGVGSHNSLDSSLVVRYISYFAYVPFESWAMDLADNEKKSIEDRQPLYSITVSTVAGGRKVLKLWATTKGEGENKTIDSDRLLGRSDNTGEFFILRYFDIDPLIKKRSYFLRE